MLSMEVSYFLRSSVRADRSDWKVREDEAKEWGGLTAAYKGVLADFRCCWEHEQCWLIAECEV